MSGIPLDLVFEMLYRLPVRTLLRFRCLSKQFCSLIDSPDFIKLHLNFSTSAKSHLTNLVVNDSGLYSLKLDSLDNDIEHHYYPEIFDKETEVFGSCHGWLALSNSEQDLFLFNPSCRKFLELPAPVNDFHHLTYVTVFYGFGHDHVNDDYKVVRIIRCEKVDHQGGFTDDEVEVFSLKNNSWRRISIFGSCLRFISDDYCPRSHRKRYGVYVSGVLHWVLPRRRELGSGESIVAFDLAVEEFRTLPQPECDYGDFALDIGVLKGRLCAICKYDRVNLDVWMMNEDEESWSKLASILRGRFGVSSFLNALTYSEHVGGGGDKFLFLEVNDEGRELVLHDLETDTHNTLRINGDPHLFAAYICVESLMPLNGRPFHHAFSRVQKEEPQKREEISKEQNRKKRDDFLSKGFKRFLYSVTRRCRRERRKEEHQRVGM